ncbi:hypothetical protein [Lactococcus lactis]|uniref:hypothetical protein n=1 Tax=Lactococcus lactis TaxID=1358 RepID=UPI0018AAED88|nr:hypothetical protein [Lactococcus lactis]
MTKSYFIKTYNLNIGLLILWLMTIFMDIVLSLLIPSFSSFDGIDLLSHLVAFLAKLQNFSMIAVYVLLFLLVLSTVKEITSRIINDSFSNYWKSIIKTLSLQRFLSQSERIEKKPDGQTENSVNPVLKDFNKAAHKAVVDIRNDQTVVFIKIPRSQQAQIILKGLESQLKEEISSRNPEYYFSSPNRINNQLWFIGTRR